MRSRWPSLTAHDRPCRSSSSRHVPVFIRYYAFAPPDSLADTDETVYRFFNLYNVRYKRTSAIISLASLTYSILASYFLFFLFHREERSKRLNRNLAILYEGSIITTVSRPRQMFSFFFFFYFSSLFKRVRHNRE